MNAPTPLTPSLFNASARPETTARSETSRMDSLFAARSLAQQEAPVAPGIVMERALHKVSSEASCWPGLVAPVLVWLLFQCAQSAHIATPNFGTTLLFGVAIAGAFGLRAGVTGTVLSVGLVGCHLVTFLRLSAPRGGSIAGSLFSGPAMERIMWFAVVAAGITLLMEVGRWRNRTALREGAVLRRELLASLQEHEKRAMELEHVFECLDDGVTWCDPSGKVVFANAEARRLHGAGADVPPALLGRDCRFITCEGRTFPRAEMPLAKAIKGEAVAQQEWNIHRADGSELVVQGGASPVRDKKGHLLGAVMTMRDTSAQRRVLAELERANRLKTEFLGVLSHELRTPLTPILGWITLLRAPNLLLQNDPETVSCALESIERSALIQRRLIDDLIDAISLLSGELHLSIAPALLSSVLEHGVEQFQETAAKRGISLHLNCEAHLPPMMLDENRFAQAVRHLLSNAIKFSEDNGSVWIRACYQPEVQVGEGQKGVVVLEVIDEGAGITADALPWIFEMFNQADGSATRQHGGLGVGLTLTRALVEMHGGDISVYSEGEGCGTRFTVVLPVPA